MANGHGRRNIVCSSREGEDVSDAVLEKVRLDPHLSGCPLSFAPGKKEEKEEEAGRKEGQTFFVVVGGVQRASGKEKRGGGCRGRRQDEEVRAVSFQKGQSTAKGSVGHRLANCCQRTRSKTS